MTLGRQQRRLEHSYSVHAERNEKDDEARSKYLSAGKLYGAAPLLLCPVFVGGPLDDDIGIVALLSMVAPKRRLDYAIASCAGESH